MSEITSVSEAFASGEEITPIVERLEGALINVPRTHALIALTSIILLLQYPNITTEQVYEGVKDVSRFVCLWLTGIDQPENLTGSEEPIPPNQLN